ncbi:hypothetical protein CAL29_01215 [Bordetella genomosp. 10]|uniref:Uncharacterized protein n=1 Tax=Bordetella genomosp. 10 TaxID=1416804 RepID=A0A261SI67_9BORD|nr:hypothetical protein [Bordetella genomosp. 10]OZI37084.1 hypothetical protein CAL29_01215 [Bordetella genomosp. 10]
MTTFRTLVCGIPGSEAKRTAYRVVHDAFCAEVFRELGQRLEDWPPASARRLAAATPPEQAACLRAWLDDIPEAWRRARGQLCRLAGHDAQACRHAGRLAWVLIATLFDGLSPPVLQTALREVPEARLVMLYTDGASHLPLFRHVARHELQRRLGNARSASQAAAREIQEQAEAGRMPDVGMLRDLSLGLRRRLVLARALSQAPGGPSAPAAGSIASAISASRDGAGLTSELQVLLDVLLALMGGGHPAPARRDDDESASSAFIASIAPVSSLVTLADARTAAHACACMRAALAVHCFVDFARNWNAPVFFDGDGQPLRLDRLLAVRAARVDDGGGKPGVQIQLAACIGVRGKHPPVTLLVVAQVDEAGTVAGLADYAQLRNARPVGDSGTFAAVV